MDVTTTDGVRHITLNRPDRRNAVSPEDVVELAAAITEVSPSEASAIRLAGKGPAFCAGGDLDAMAEREWPRGERARRVEATFGRLARAMLEAEVPIVARVHGDAVGAGLALVALSDFAFASTEARFNAGFARVGLVPDVGGSFLLPKLLGLRTAKDLALTARFVDAEEANRIDLVNDTVDPETLDDRVDACLDRLADLPTATLGRIRRTIHHNLGRPYPDALAFEAHEQAAAYDTPAHKEGVAAFRDGREPEY